MSDPREHHANVHPKCIPIHHRHPILFPIGSTLAISGILPLVTSLPREWEYGLTGTGTLGIIILFFLLLRDERRAKSAAIGHLLLGLFLLSVALLLPALIADFLEGR